MCAMAKGFIVYTTCCMGKALAVLMTYNGLNKKSTDMKEKFSLLRYTIELAYIKKLNELKWWQFSKRKEVNKWRESQLHKC